MKKLGMLMMIAAMLAAGCKGGKHGGCNDCPDLTKRKKHAMIVAPSREHLA